MCAPLRAAAAGLACALLAARAAPPTGTPPAAPATPAPTAVPEQLSPTPEEDGAIQQLISETAWVRRLVAAQRLERWPTNGYAAKHLATLARDKDARVRSTAVLGLARVGADQLADRAQSEDNPRVIRTMLRCGWTLDNERVERGARDLMKSDVASDRLLGVEIAAALQLQGPGAKPLMAAARQTLISVISRLDSETAGALSPRLALLTGAPDYRIASKWRIWLGRNQPSLSMKACMLVGASAPAATPDAVTKLDSSEFVRFATALREAFAKPIDLGIAIDCTASMSSRLAQAQGGVSDVMQFAGAAAGSARVAVVGYRDQGDDWTLKSSDFTANRASAQANLFKLTAGGGGDEPEMVYEALRVAYGQFSWRPDANVQRVLVLVGDAPPHPGYGGYSVDLARNGKQAGITTFVISAQREGRDEVKHFAEIARAGGGRVIRLAARSDLAAEIAGVAIADTWHDPMVAVFERYLLVAR